MKTNRIFTAVPDLAGYMYLHQIPNNAALARLLGFSRSFVSHIRAGRKQPSTNFRAECEKLFGTESIRFQDYGTGRN